MRSHLVRLTCIFGLLALGAAAMHLWRELDRPPAYDVPPAPLYHHPRVANEVAESTARALTLLRDDHILVRRYGRCHDCLAARFEYSGRFTGGGPIVAVRPALIVTVVGEFDKGQFVFDVWVNPGPATNQVDLIHIEPTDEGLASLGRPYREEYRDGELLFVSTDGADEVTSYSRFRLQTTHPEVYESLPADSR